MRDKLYIKPGNVPILLVPFNIITDWARYKLMLFIVNECSIKTIFDEDGTELSYKEHLHQPGLAHTKPRDSLSADF